jgi:hypothetical protein
MVRLTYRVLQKFKPPVPGSDSRFWAKTRNFHYIYNFFIAILSLFIVLKGVNIIIQGIEGNIEWILNLFGNESSIKHATPGVFIVLVGLLFFYIGRDKVEFKGH